MHVVGCVETLERTYTVMQATMRNRVMLHASAFDQSHHPQGHVQVAMHSEGRYAFVELASPEMATAALSLSGALNFLGSQMTVGRPSGYIDPSKAQAAAAAASKALADLSEQDLVLEKGAAPPASREATAAVCIDGMATAAELESEEEYQVRWTACHESVGVVAFCVADLLCFCVVMLV